MAPAFDPYYKWLGIPPAEQPPNHYRLLAINLFESDPDVIEAAADQRMAHLRSLQTGQHADLSQTLLNKISAARVCLLKTATKTQYDDSLRAQQGSSLAAPPPAPTEIPVAAVVPLPPDVVPPASAPAAPIPDWASEPPSVGTRSGSFKPKTHAAAASRQSGLPLQWIIGAPVVGVVVVIAMIVMNSNPDDRAERSGGSPSTIAGGNGSTSNSSSNKNGKTSSTPHGSSSKSPGSKNVPHDDVPPKPPVTPEPPANPPTSTPTISSVPPISTPPKNPPPPDKTPPTKPPTDKPPVEKPPGKPPEKKLPPDTRLPIPDATAQQKALGQLREVLKNDYALALTYDSRLALAHKLGKLAESEKDPTMRYVMTSQGIEQADRVGDVVLTFDLVAKLCQLYQVDVWDLRSKTFAKLPRTAKAGDARQALVDRLLPLVDEALADGHYDAAVSLSVTAVAATADKLADPVLRERTREAHERASRLQRAAEEYATAADRLGEDPSDAAAQLTVGRFLCLERNDWKEGLLHLSHASDEALKNVALLELAAPSQAEAQVNLANAWWDLSEKPGTRNGQWAKPMAVRARFWYARAIPGLTGLPLEKAQQRMREEGPPGETAVRGIFLDDLPEQDVSVGYGSIGKHGATGFPKDNTAQQVLLRGLQVKHALFTHPPKTGSAKVAYMLDGKLRMFSATVGIMEGAGDTKSAMTFKVLADGKLQWASRPLQHPGDVQECRVRLPPLHLLQLEVQCPGDNSHAWSVWLNPMLSK